MSEQNKPTEEFAIKLRIFDFDNTITKETQPNFNNHVYKKIHKTILAKKKISVSLDDVTSIGLQSYRDYGHSAIGLAAHFGLAIDELYDGYHFRKNPGINQCDRAHTNNLKSFCAHALATGEQVRNCILTHSTMNWVTRSLKFLRKEKGVKKLRKVFNEKADNIFTAEQYRLRDRLGNITQFFKASSYIPFWLTCAKMDVDPRECSMVEDSLKNLEIAKKLGMQTIYIDHGNALETLPDYVDYQISSLAEIENIPNKHEVKDTLEFNQFIDVEFAKAKAAFCNDNVPPALSRGYFAEPKAA